MKTPRGMEFLLSLGAMIVICFGVPSRAVADVAAPPEGYRLQMMGADLLSVGLVAGSVGSVFSSPSLASGLALSAVAVGVAGAPIVHLAHGHSKRAALSLGVRTLAPVLGMIVGGLAAGGGDCGGHDDPDVCNFANGFGVAIGWFVGYSAALVTDYAFIASMTSSEHHASANVSKAATAGSLSFGVMPKAGGLLLAGGGTF